MLREDVSNDDEVDDEDRYGLVFAECRESFRSAVLESNTKLDLTDWTVSLKCHRMHQPTRNRRQLTKYQPPRVKESRIDARS